MKKYFLAIAVFFVVFLGLGSSAQTVQPIGDNNTNNQQQNTTEPCKEDMTFSTLAGKPHAIVAIPGVSCKCEPGWGEYYSGGQTLCGPCEEDYVCCGIKLNTSVPFIGNCIETKDDNPKSSLEQGDVFPVLMSSLTQILVTIILIVSFVLIIIGGIQIATGNPSGGKKMIIRVVIAIAILGASGVILRLINPNFFG